MRTSNGLPLYLPTLLKKKKTSINRKTFSNHEYLGNESLLQLRCYMRKAYAAVLNTDPQDHTYRLIVITLPKPNSDIYLFSVVSFIVCPEGGLEILHHGSWVPVPQTSSENGFAIAGVLHPIHSASMIRITRQISALFIFSVKPECAIDSVEYQHRRIKCEGGKPP